ncbi:MAG: winged helix-turn-helix domain-containing protein [archaeon]
MDSNEYFGSKAGTVWGVLNGGKPMNVFQIKKVTKLKSEHVFAALGWLAREGKIGMSQNKFYLTE